MDLNVFVEDLRNAAENLRKNPNNGKPLSTIYCHKAIKVVEKVSHWNSDYEHIITGLWVIIAHFTETLDILVRVPSFKEAATRLFRECGKAVLNIQWQNLEEDSDVRQRFVVSLANLNAKLVPLNYQRFRLLETLLENPWTDPTLAKIMGGEAEDEEEKEEVRNYIAREDAIILQLRVDMMLKENCEEYALNLCNSCLLHPELKRDLTLRKTQLSLLHKLGLRDKLQEEMTTKTAVDRVDHPVKTTSLPDSDSVVHATATQSLPESREVQKKSTMEDSTSEEPKTMCQSLSVQEAVNVIRQLQTRNTKEICTVLAQTFMVQHWIRQKDHKANKDLLRLWIRQQALADKDQDRFKESVWAIAKLSQSTEQILFFIDILREQCGKAYLQLYVDMCIFAINVDKGQMETSLKQGQTDAVKARKEDMSAICGKLACLNHHASIKVARICVLTAFVLKPSLETFQSIIKFYSQNYNCCVTCNKTSNSTDHGAVNPATLYEVERLLNFLRPEYLNPDNSLSNIKILCERFCKENNLSIPLATTVPKPPEENAQLRMVQIEAFGKPKANSTKPSNVFEAVAPSNVNNTQTLLRNKIQGLQNPQQRPSSSTNPNFPVQISVSQHSRPNILQSGPRHPSPSTLHQLKGNASMLESFKSRQPSLKANSSQQQFPSQSGNTFPSAQGKQASTQPKNPTKLNPQLIQYIQSAIRQNSSVVQELMKHPDKEIVRTVINMLNQAGKSNVGANKSLIQQQQSQTTSLVDQSRLPTVSTLLRPPSAGGPQGQQSILQPPSALSSSEAGVPSYQSPKSYPHHMSNQSIQIPTSTNLGAAYAQRAESFKKAKIQAGNIRSVVQTSLLHRQQVLSRQMSGSTITVNQSSSGLPEVRQSANSNSSQNIQHHGTSQSHLSSNIPNHSTFNNQSAAQPSLRNTQQHLQPQSDSLKLQPTLSSDELSGSIMGIDDKIITELLKDAGIFSNTFPDIEVDFSLDDLDKKKDGRPTGTSYDLQHSDQLKASASRAGCTSITQQGSTSSSFSGGNINLNQLSVFDMKSSNSSVSSSKQNKSSSASSVGPKPSQLGNILVNRQQSLTEGKPLRDSSLRLANESTAQGLPHMSVEQIREMMKQEQIDGEVTMDSSNNATYRCIICSLAFKVLEELREHVRNVCKPGLQSSSVYNTKIKQDHANSAKAGLETTTVFQCLRCFELCISQEGIKQHRLTCKRVPTVPPDIKNATLNSKSNKTPPSSRSATPKMSSSQPQTKAIVTETKPRVCDTQSSKIPEKPLSSTFPSSNAKDHIKSVQTASCGSNKINETCMVNNATVSNQLSVIARDVKLEKDSAVKTSDTVAKKEGNAKQVEKEVKFEKTEKTDVTLKADLQVPLQKPEKAVPPLTQSNYSEISGSGGCKFYRCKNCSQTLCSYESLLSHWKDCATKPPVIPFRNQQFPFDPDDELEPGEIRPLVGKVLQNVLDVIDAVARGDIGEMPNIDSDVEDLDILLSQGHTSGINETHKILQGKISKKEYRPQSFLSSDDSSSNSSGHVSNRKISCLPMKKDSIGKGVLKEKNDDVNTPRAASTLAASRINKSLRHMDNDETIESDEEECQSDGSDESSREAPPTLRDRTKLKPIQSYINESFVSPYSRCGVQKTSPLSSIRSKIKDSISIGETTNQTATEPEKGDFKCIICNKICNSKRILIQHYAGKHLQPYTMKSLTDGSSYFCHLCQKSFNTFMHYMHHVPNHGSAIMKKMSSQYSNLTQKKKHWSSRIAASRGFTVSNGVKKGGISPKRAKALLSKKKAAKSVRERMKKVMSKVALMSSSLSPNGKVKALFLNRKKMERRRRPKSAHQSLQEKLLKRKIESKRHSLSKDVPLSETEDSCASSSPYMSDVSDGDEYQASDDGDSDSTINEPPQTRNRSRVTRFSGVKFSNKNRDRRVVKIDPSTLIIHPESLKNSNISPCVSVHRLTQSEIQKLSRGKEKGVAPNEDNLSAAEMKENTPKLVADVPKSNALEEDAQHLTQSTNSIESTQKTTEEIVKIAEKKPLHYMANFQSSYESYIKGVKVPPSRKTKKKTEGHDSLPDHKSSSNEVSDEQTNSALGNNQQNGPEITGAITVPINADEKETLSDDSLLREKEIISSVRKRRCSVNLGLKIDVDQMKTPEVKLQVVEDKDPFGGDSCKSPVPLVSRKCNTQHTEALSKDENLKSPVLPACTVVLERSELVNKNTIHPGKSVKTTSDSASTQITIGLDTTASNESKAISGATEIGVISSNLSPFQVEFEEFSLKEKKESLRSPTSGSECSNSKSKFENKFEEFLLMEKNVSKTIPSTSVGCCNSTFEDKFEKFVLAEKISPPISECNDQVRDKAPHNYDKDNTGEIIAVEENIMNMENAKDSNVAMSLKDDLSVEVQLFVKDALESMEDGMCSDDVLSPKERNSQVVDIDNEQDNGHQSVDFDIDNHEEANSEGGNVLADGTVSVDDIEATNEHELTRNGSEYFMDKDACLDVEAQKGVNCLVNEGMMGQENTEDAGRNKESQIIGSLDEGITGQEKLEMNSEGNCFSKNSEDSGERSNLSHYELNHDDRPYDSSVQMNEDNLDDVTEGTEKVSAELVPCSNHGKLSVKETSLNIAGVNEINNDLQDNDQMPEVEIHSEEMQEKQSNHNENSVVGTDTVETEDDIGLDITSLKQIENPLESTFDHSIETTGSFSVFQQIKDKGQETETDSGPMSSQQIEASFNISSVSCLNPEVPQFEADTEQSSKKMLDPSTQNLEAIEGFDQGLSNSSETSADLPLQFISDAVNNDAVEIQVFIGKESEMYDGQNEQADISKITEVAESHENLEIKNGEETSDAKVPESNSANREMQLEKLQSSSAEHFKTMEEKNKDSVNDVEFLSECSKDKEKDNLEDISYSINCENVGQKGKDSEFAIVDMSQQLYHPSGTNVAVEISDATLDKSFTETNMDTLNGKVKEDCVYKTGIVCEKEKAPVDSSTFGGMLSFDIEKCKEGESVSGDAVENDKGSVSDVTEINQLDELIVPDCDSSENKSPKVIDTMDEYKISENSNLDHYEARSEVKVSPEYVHALRDSMLHSDRVHVNISGETDCKEMDLQWEDIKSSGSSHDDSKKEEKVSKNTEINHVEIEKVQMTEENETHPGAEVDGENVIGDIGVNQEDKSDKSSSDYLALTGDSSGVEVVAESEDRTTLAEDRSLNVDVNELSGGIEKQNELRVDQDEMVSGLDEGAKEVDDDNCKVDGEIPGLMDGQNEHRVDVHRKIEDDILERNEKTEGEEASTNDVEDSHEDYRLADEKILGAEENELVKRTSARNEGEGRSNLEVMTHIGNIASSLDSENDVSGVIAVCSDECYIEHNDQSVEKAEDGDEHYESDIDILDVGHSSDDSVCKETIRNGSEDFDSSITLDPLQNVDIPESKNDEKELDEDAFKDVLDLESEEGNRGLTVGGSLDSDIGSVPSDQRRDTNSQTQHLYTNDVSRDHKLLKDMDNKDAGHMIVFESIDQVNANTTDDSNILSKEYDEQYKQSQELMTVGTQHEEVGSVEPLNVDIVDQVEKELTKKEDLSTQVSNIAVRELDNQDVVVADKDTSNREDIDIVSCSNGDEKAGGSVSNSNGDEKYGGRASNSNEDGKAEGHSSILKSPENDVNLCQDEYVIKMTESNNRETGRDLDVGSEMKSESPYKSDVVSPKRLETAEEIAVGGEAKAENDVEHTERVVKKDFKDDDAEFEDGKNVTKHEETGEDAGTVKSFGETQEMLDEIVDHSNGQCLITRGEREHQETDNLGWIEKVGNTEEVELEDQDIVYEEEDTIDKNNSIMQETLPLARGSDGNGFSKHASSIESFPNLFMFPGKEESRNPLTSFMEAGSVESYAEVTQQTEQVGELPVGEVKLTDFESERTKDDLQDLSKDSFGHKVKPTEGVLLKKREESCSLALSIKESSEITGLEKQRQSIVSSNTDLPSEEAESRAENLIDHDPNVGAITYSPQCIESMESFGSLIKETDDILETKLGGENEKKSTSDEGKRSSTGDKKDTSERTKQNSPGEKVVSQEKAALDDNDKNFKHGPIEHNTAVRIGLEQDQRQVKGDKNNALKTDEEKERAMALKTGLEEKRCNVAGITEINNWTEKIDNFKNDKEETNASKHEDDWTNKDSSLGTSGVRDLTCKKVGATRIEDPVKARKRRSSPKQLRTRSRVYYGHNSVMKLPDDHIIVSKDKMLTKAAEKDQIDQNQDHVEQDEKVEEKVLKKKRGRPKKVVSDGTEVNKKGRRSGVKSVFANKTLVSGQIYDNKTKINNDVRNLESGRNIVTMQNEHVENDIVGHETDGKQDIEKAINMKLGEKTETLCKEVIDSHDNKNDACEKEIVLESLEISKGQMSVDDSSIEGSVKVTDKKRNETKAKVLKGGKDKSKSLCLEISENNKMDNEDKVTEIELLARKDMRDMVMRKRRSSSLNKTKRKQKSTACDESKEQDIEDELEEPSFRKIVENEEVEVTDTTNEEQVTKEDTNFTEKDMMTENWSHSRCSEEVDLKNETLVKDTLPHSNGSDEDDLSDYNLVVEEDRSSFKSFPNPFVFPSIKRTRKSPSSSSIGFADTSEKTDKIKEASVEEDKSFEHEGESTADCLQTPSSASVGKECGHGTSKVEKGTFKKMTWLERKRQAFKEKKREESIPFTWDLDENSGAPGREKQVKSTSPIYVDVHLDAEARLEQLDHDPALTANPSSQQKEEPKPSELPKTRFEKKGKKLKEHSQDSVNTNKKKHNSRKRLSSPISQTHVKVRKKLHSVTKPTTDSKSTTTESPIVSCPKKRGRKKKSLSGTSLDKNTSVSEEKLNNSPHFININDDEITFNTRSLSPLYASESTPKSQTNSNGKKRGRPRKRPMEDSDSSSQCSIKTKQSNILDSPSSSSSVNDPKLKKAGLIPVAKASTPVPAMPSPIARKFIASPSLAPSSPFINSDVSVSILSSQNFAKNEKSSPLYSKLGPQNKKYSEHSNVFEKLAIKSPSWPSKDKSTTVGSNNSNSFAETTMSKKVKVKKDSNSSHDMCKATSTAAVVKRRNPTSVRKHFDFQNSVKRKHTKPAKSQTIVYKVDPLPKSASSSSSLSSEQFEKDRTLHTPLPPGVTHVKPKKTATGDVKWKIAKEMKPSKVKGKQRGAPVSFKRT